MGRAPRIAVVSSYDAHDREAFGGRCYYLASELERQAAPRWIGPLSHSRHWLRLRSRQIIARRMSHRSFWPSRDTQLVQDYSRQVDAALHGSDCEAVLSLISPGSQPIAYVKDRRPLVIWSDATFAGFYESFPQEGAAMARETWRDGAANERAALKRCSLAIYSSEWAAAGATSHYGLDPAKTRVVPYGANIEPGTEHDEAAVEELIQARPNRMCRLFFAGWDWQRKRGDFAVEVARLLNKRRLPTQLVVLADPNRLSRHLPSFVEFYGYVSKSTVTGLRQWNRLLAGSHFCILPTMSDASPLIFAEAAAFGVPSVATDAGGIATTIRNDVNGRMFTPGATPDAYCDYIMGVMAHYSRYTELAASAFDDYRGRLNWRVAVKTVLQEIGQLVGVEAPGWRMREMAPV
jgi:glycosyltransferase involved in cell wall biosynthesis